MWQCLLFKGEESKKGVNFIYEIKTTVVQKNVHKKQLEKQINLQFAQSCIRFSAISQKSHDYLVLLNCWKMST